MLRTMAQSIFEKRDSLSPAPYYLPDAAYEGTLRAHVLCEEGVDYTQSELLPVAAHMTEALTAMCAHSDVVGGCFIGLSDGTHIGVDGHELNKFDENGDVIPFPVRERPWYVGAADRYGRYIFHGHGT